MAARVELEQQPVEHAQLARGADDLLERRRVGVVLRALEQERVVAHLGCTGDVMHCQVM